MDTVKEIIVVEGRDDTAAIKRAVDAVTIETHGFGIRAEVWQRIEKAYRERGIIIFTDPDHAGNEIRRRLLARFPDAKEAFLAGADARKAGDIGIENGSPEAIRDALRKARRTLSESRSEFTMEDLHEHGLAGAAGAAARREQVGKRLGIGYGNSAAFLNKLNQYNITREEFKACITAAVGAAGGMAGEAAGNGTSAVIPAGGSGESAPEEQ